MRSRLAILLLSACVVPRALYAEGGHNNKFKATSQPLPISAPVLSLPDWATGPAQEEDEEGFAESNVGTPKATGPWSGPKNIQINLEEEDDRAVEGAEEPSDIFSSRKASDKERSVPWIYDEYNAIAEDESLLELLQNFCRNQKIPAKFYTELGDIEVNGNFKNIRPQRFLDRLSEAYGLTWFFDGNMLHIDTQDNMQSLYLNLKTGRSADRLRYLLSTMGLKASNYTIRFLENNNMFYLSGPKQFVENIQELVEKENSVAIQSRAETTVRVFPLKYAYAQDITVNYNQESISIPGVATTLQELMNNMGENSELVVNKRTGSKSSKLKGKGLSRQRPKTDPNKNKSDDEPLKPTNPTGQEDEDFVAAQRNVLIRPDIRNNSVIIRDTVEQMSLYETLIEQLDQPQQVITITAAIVDISSDFTQELGVNFFDWNKTTGQGQLSVGPGGNATLPSDGFNIAGRILSDNDEFLGRVQLLEKDNQAKVLARPSVVTFNNMEAIISQDETFYVRVDGDREVDLFDVHAGTILKVTPSIVGLAGDPEPKIRLLINIEDGSALSTQVDNIPRTQKSFINTQAIVGQNQSLLVGGYFRERETHDESGIPILRKLPIIGLAFKKKTQVKGTVERMFLISPRIVPLEELQSKEYEPYLKKPSPFKHPEPRSMLRDNTYVSQANTSGPIDPAWDHATANTPEGMDAQTWLEFERNPAVNKQLEDTYRADAQKHRRTRKGLAGNSQAIGPNTRSHLRPHDAADPLELASDTSAFNDDVTDPALDALYKAQDAFLLKSRLAYRFRGKAYRSAAHAPSAPAA